MYVVTILELLLIYALLTLSLNLVVGLAGQVNLGHAAFFGIGAYAGGTLLKAGAPFTVALAAGAAASTALGLVLGAVSLRLRGDYLAIATIGFNFAVVAALLYTPYFGGAYGLSGIPRGLAPSTYLLALLATFGLAVFIHERVQNSESGYAFVALRDSEVAAEALGLNVNRFKLVAFALSTALAGVAGVFYAAYIGTLRPEDFGFPLSVTLMAMLVVGGMGGLWGPILGAFLLGGFAQAFAFVHNYQAVLYGLLLALVMRYRPQGILGRVS